MINSRIALAFFLLLTAFPILIQAQGFPWRKSYLTASQYLSNGVELYNNTDNAMRVRVSGPGGKLIQEKICNPKSKTRFTFPVAEVNKAYVNQLRVAIYYDVECYDKDMRRIRQIAQQRYQRAVNRRRVEAAFRSLFSIGQLYDEDSWQYRYGSLGNSVMDLFDGYDDYRRKGINDAVINYANGKAREWKLQKLTRSDRAGTAINNLVGLKNLLEKEIEFETGDLQAAALLALDYVSDKELYKYSFSYSEFAKIVDPDGDGITNRYDDCDNVAGTAKYGGCTKEIIASRKKARYKQRRRLARYSYPSFSLSAHYFTADFPNSINAARDKELFEASGFDLGVELPIYRHRWFGAVRGGLWIGGSARLSDFSFNDLADDEKINIIDETYYSAEVSYGLLIGETSPVRLMIKPLYGKVLGAKVRAGGFFLNGEEAPENYFIPANDDPDVYYYGFDLRLLIGGAAEYSNSRNGVSASLPISLNFGMRYYDNTYPAITNDAVTNGLSIDGAPFVYPSTLRDMRFGLSIHF